MNNSIKNNIKINNGLLKGSSSYHLDFIRGAAAILVLVNHFRNIFFVKYEDIDFPNVLLLLLYSIAGLGHQAVIVFFVLSGFFISNSVLTKVYNNTWSWKYYLINRLTRLYVVLIPVLVIGFLIDLIGSNFLDYSFFPNNIDNGLSFSVLVGNLFFLQEIYVPVLGSNDPLWSLSYEFWYYILFPCIIFIFVKKKSGFMVGLYSILTILLMTVLGVKILQYFIIWLLGVLILVSPAIKIKSNFYKVMIKSVGLFSFIAVLGISRLGLLPSAFVSDLLVAITFSSFIYTILHFETKFITFSSLKLLYYSFSKKIASFSFTLYLVHFPVLIFLFAFINNLGIDRMQPTYSNMLIGVGICLGIILITYIMSLFTEGKTSQVRAIVIRKLNHEQGDSNKQIFKKDKVS